MEQGGRSPDVEPCRWCGEAHGLRCPWVKALNFDILNNITRVEFLTPADMGPAASAQHDDDQTDYPKYPPTSFRR